MRPVLALAVLAMATGCGRSTADARRPLTPQAPGARVGIDPVPSVRLVENHSRVLALWRRAGVLDRVLVHVDGHADLDWLPDVTIARLAAADPDELEALEHRPYALDRKTLGTFCSSNFIYPAARLGIVREFVWVVPDGTLHDRSAAEDLVRRTILDKLQMISLPEAKTLHIEGRTIRGTVLGLRTTICELADLPAFDEPVLLDIDLDFFTTRSAASQGMAPWPLITPGALVAALRSRGVRTDLATISLSTIGGFAPPACRWLGQAFAAALLRAPEAESERFERRAQADALYAQGRDDEAGAAFRELAAAYPDDGSIWYALALAEARDGHQAAELTNRDKAAAADPIFADAPLFEADALFLNQRYAEALKRYRGYRRQHPAGPFLAYTLHREAGCLLRTGRSQEATGILRKLVTIAPDHGDVRMDLGMSLCEDGDLDGAIEQFQEARRILPDRADYAMALGTAYAEKHRFDEAVEALEAAVARRPTWAQAQLRLGLLLAQMSRPLDAAGHLNAAAFLSPRNPRIAQVIAKLKRQGVSTTEVAAHP